MDNTLIICSDSQKAEDHNPDIILSEEIHNISKTKADKLYEELQCIDVDDQRLESAYRIVSKQVWADGGGLHEHSPRSLELLPILYERIVGKITQDTNKIKCIGVSGRYLDLLKDLSENESMKLESQKVANESITDRLLLVRSFIWLTVSFFDAILSLLLRPIFDPTDADLLVKYPIFRPDTISSVEEELNISFDATCTLLTISYFRRGRNNIATTTTLIPVRCFGDIPQMICNYRFVWYILSRTILKNEFGLEVVDNVEDISGVRLERTISRLVRRAILSNLGALLYSGTLEKLFSSGEYEQLLITSTGPSGRGIAFPAIKSNIRPYVLHHSIVTPREPYDKSYYRQRFCEGTILKTALKDSKNERIRPIPTGLPKHLQIAEMKRQSTIKSEGSEKLLIGTQPFADRYRKAFIADILSSVLKNTQFDIIIKVHPAEKKEFYTSFINELNISSDLGRVKVKDTDLYKSIQQCELLLTVSSNVALESVILGTPTAVYNPWSPNFRNPMYVTYGSVPQFTDAEEFTLFLKDESLNEIHSEEVEMLKDQYMVKNNSFAQFHRRINEELKS